MAVDSPSVEAATFTEQPAKTGSGVLELARKYWYVTLAIVVVVGFLIYTFIRNSSAQVGTANTTATTGTTNGTVDGAGPISAPLPIDQGVAAWPGGDPHGMPVGYRFIGPPAFGPPSRGVNQSPPNTLPLSQPYGPSVSDIEQRGRLAFPRPQPQRGANQSLAIGGPPASGVAVPFGTHATPHDPLRSSGTMYTRDRSIRVS